MAVMRRLVPLGLTLKFRLFWSNLLFIGIIQDNYDPHHIEKL